MSGSWITDHSGTRWVEYAPVKRRKTPRAVRFADIKVDDQVMKPWNRWRDEAPTIWYYIVTDLWFDPVKGQNDHVAGEMVAIVKINPDGSVHPSKWAHTKRGLASQGFHYADRDFIEFAKQRIEAENVVGIGFGNVIRRRPKIPGTRLLITAHTHTKPGSTPPHA